MTVLLDASALLALINEEPGAEEVENVLGDAAISAVNIAEVAAKLAEVDWSPSEISAMVTDLQMDVIDFNLNHAVMSAELRSETKQFGLSLADRACLAVGIDRQLEVITADRVWLELTHEELSVRSIR